jgi:hypothetical protein
MRSAKDDPSSTHQVLLDFSRWFDANMRTIVRNVHKLKAVAPKDVTNPVLRFVVPHTTNHVVEHTTLRVMQAWDILSAELKRQGMRPLGTSGRDYQHLSRIRDELVAHRVENELPGPVHADWYKKTYGSYEKVLDVAYRVAQKLANRIKKLEATGRLRGKPSVVRNVPQFTAEDVEKMLNALKDHGLY